MKISSAILLLLVTFIIFRLIKLTLLNNYRTAINKFNTIDCTIERMQAELIQTDNDLHAQAMKLDRCGGCPIGKTFEHEVELTALKATSGSCFDQLEQLNLSVNGYQNYITDLRSLVEQPAIASPEIDSIIDRQVILINNLDAQWSQIVHLRGIINGQSEAVTRINRS